YQLLGGGFPGRLGRLRLGLGSLRSLRFRLPCWLRRGLRFGLLLRGPRALQAHVLDLQEREHLAVSLPAGASGLGPGLALLALRAHVWIHISWVNSIPRPPQVGQVSENDSKRPADTRLRVTSRIPSALMSNTCERVLSLARDSRIVPTTLPLFCSSSMSMKSM